MFDIVLGATARGDVAEVQLFVHYLNLKTGRRTHRQASGKERGRKEKKRKESCDRQTRAAEKSRSAGSVSGQETKSSFALQLWKEFGY